MLFPWCTFMLSTINVENLRPHQVWKQSTVTSGCNSRIIRGPTLMLNQIKKSWKPKWDNLILYLLLLVNNCRTESFIWSDLFIQSSQIDSLIYFPCDHDRTSTPSWECLWFLLSVEERCSKLTNVSSFHLVELRRYLMKKRLILPLACFNSGLMMMSKEKSWTIQRDFSCEHCERLWTRFKMRATRLTRIFTSG